MKTRPSPFPRAHRAPRTRAAAFSLVEVALALGVVGFALVGIVGALPVAMNNERMSVAQTRAASVATTIFARFRAQPFNAVLYADDNDKNPLDLNTRNTPPGAGLTDPSVVLADAVFDETATTASATDTRRLHIYALNSSIPTGVFSYKIVFRFKNTPAGMLTPYHDASGNLRAEGNSIELSVYQDARPTDKTFSPKTTDVYHFSTVIANRTS